MVCAAGEMKLDDREIRFEPSMAGVLDWVAPS